jgi:competence protein ComEC
VPNRRLAAAIAILGVVAYTLLVGADAAVVRAAIMGIIVVFGVIVGRKGVAYNSLAAAIIVMTALNPYVLWDAGLQLSVAATLGLIVYGERFERVAQRVLERRLSTERATWVIKWMSEMLLLTLAAQILVSPLIVKHFGQLSLISLLSNALVLPIQPLVMITGGAATLAGLAFEPLGQLLGWWAFLPLTWTIRVVEWTAGFPYASVPLKLSDQGMVAVYGVIIGLTGLVLLSAERRRALWESVHSGLPRKVALGGMGVTAIVAWFAVLQLPSDDKLMVTFLDVGQGDAVFIETPKGAQILVDGGPEGDTLLSELGHHMPFWDRTLDLVVLTHPDADHLTGLVAALERYDVRAVIVREQPLETDLAEAWEMSLATEGATLIGGEAGTRIELSDGVTLEILHPGPGPVADDTGSTNNDSIVMRLVYGDVAFLLTGDIEATVEKELVRSGAYLRSSVLKLPHHGSNTSSSRAFLDAVRPQVAVISVGSDNDFGHPSREVLERLGKNTLVYRTDQNGSVTVTSDGRRLWIETER